MFDHKATYNCNYLHILNKILKVCGLKVPTLEKTKYLYALEIIHSKYLRILSTHDFFWAQKITRLFLVA